MEFTKKYEREEEAGEVSKPLGASNALPNAKCNRDFQQRNTNQRNTSLLVAKQVIS